MKNFILKSITTAAGCISVMGFLSTDYTGNMLIPFNMLVWGTVWITLFAAVNVDRVGRNRDEVR